MISRTGLHAVTALAALAELTDGVFAGAAEIAEQTGAPRNYLGKLLKALADQGLLESQKGKGGGFRLARHADNISLLEIMEPLERVSRWGGCFLGRPRCSDDAPCSVHRKWAKVRTAYLRFMEETSVGDLVERHTR